MGKLLIIDLLNKKIPAMLRSLALSGSDALPSGDSHIYL
jgi:hypothetical protein